MKRPVKRIFKAYLDNVDSRLEPGAQLIQNFGDELLMFQNFSHLHNSNYRRLYEKFPVFLYVLVGRFLLDLQLGFHRYVYIDPQFFTAETSEQLALKFL